MNRLRNPLVLTALAAFILALNGSDVMATNQTKDDRSIVNYLFEESNKPEEYSQEHLNQIAAFAYEKALNYAKHNKQFAKDEQLPSLKEWLEEVEERYSIVNIGLEGAVSLIKLDNNHVLVYLQTTFPAVGYAQGGILFLINKTKPDWTPLQLDHWEDDKKIRSYSVNNLNYEPPKFSTFMRNGEGGYYSPGIEDQYLFNNGSIKHIRSFHTIHDERLSEGNEEEVLMDLIAKGELSDKVYYVDEHVAKMYNQFSGKDPEDLNKRENWNNIYCIKANRAYFHNQPNDTKRNDLFVIRGDVIYISEIKGAWGMAHYLDLNNKATYGWIRLRDVMKL